MTKPMNLSTSIKFWLIPLGGLLTLLGYFGPWVNHRVAGLVIMALDLGEYVKFLPEVRSQQINLWREGFYLPLMTVSLAFSLYAFRTQPGFQWPRRIFMVVVAGVAALNMLPPAWTPPKLITAEFRLQTVAILICLAAVAFSPFLALIPQRIAMILVVGLSGLACWFPIANFLRVLPAISTLYNHLLTPGWGMYAMAGGLILLASGSVWLVYHPSPTVPE
ncbi:MAG: hypothetical protein NT075_30665 [Chloroflexi bacterium]|nr:hypothetical protein [Chloroflexota bacterium]